MSKPGPKPKRSYGAGGLRQIGNSWYGTWRDAEGRKVQRKIGAVRTTGRAGGIIKLDAEMRLAQLRKESTALVSPDDRVTMEAAGAELCARLGLRGRKKSHQLTTATDLRNHIVPFFGDKTLDKIRPIDVERYIVAKQKTLAIKTIRNHVNTIHSVFELGPAPRLVPQQPRQERRPAGHQEERDPHPFPRPRRAGEARQLVLSGRRLGQHRTDPVSDRRDDGAAPGRGARVALA